MVPDFLLFRRCCNVAIAWGCLFFFNSSAATEPDPFATVDRVAASAHGRMGLARENIAPCLFAQVPAPLGLLEAIDRALCLHPQTRLAWATGKGARRSAWLGAIRLFADIECNREQQPGAQS